MIKVIILTEAENEMKISAHYYNQKASGLGYDFVEEVEKAINNIQNSPERWLFVDETIQRYNLHRFPFSIYYEYLYKENQIIIVSIAHYKRFPGYWKKRI